MVKTDMVDNVVRADVYKSPLDKLRKSAMVMDSETTRSVSAAMRDMLGDKKAVAIRVSAV